MAKARMLHNKISKSLQVDGLPLPAQLLFTWMIAYADDEGKLRGEPKYIKGTVIPYKNWPESKVKDYLNKMRDAGLIYCWQINNEWIVQFVNWDEYQHIRKDRFEPSRLPSFRSTNDNQMTTISQPDDNPITPQSNAVEDNPIEVKKSEYKNIADKKTPKAIGELINPKSFTPNTEAEKAALDAWEKLESDNPLAFQTTYLKAARRGLPGNLFYLFVSEIKQSPGVVSRGAVFNSKAEQYLSKREQ